MHTKIPRRTAAKAMRAQPPPDETAQRAASLPEISDRVLLKLTLSSHRAFDLPDDVLDRLGKLARILDQHHYGLFTVYAQSVPRLAWSRLKTPLPVNWCGFDEDAKRSLKFLEPETRASLVRLGRIALEYKDALQSCVVSERAASLLNEMLPSHNALKVGGRPLSLPEYWNRIIPLLEFAQIAGEAAKRRPGEPALGGERGRPKLHEALEEVVFSLLWAVEIAGGGHLTFTNIDGGRGTLIDALEVLRPFLPESALPKKLPISTIKRTVTAFRFEVSKNRKNRP